MYISIQDFMKEYPIDNIRGIKSPLRMCPLGAHVDHQDGLVTGMALDSSVNMLFVPRNDGYIRVQSLDFPDEEYFHLDQVPGMVPGTWGNYLRGAVLSLQENFKLKHGLSAVISGKLPIGGLSSSAAVTTAYLMALCDVNDIHLSKIELVQYSHWVETQFIGLKNGILDQASNIISEDQKLMFMDCKTSEYKLIEQPEHMLKFEVVVVYSGINKSLIGTDYNNRVDECRVAGWLLQELGGTEIDSLQDMRLRKIPREVYDTYGEQLPGRFRRRAEHFYKECERVEQGVEAWAQGDLEAFGQLMFQSGDSSMLQYECGCTELITIFEILKKTKGVYGARFSGAGYRGCCIGLIDPSQREAIKVAIDQEYPIKHPQYKDTYEVNFCNTSDGAHKMSRKELEELFV